MQIMIARALMPLENRSDWSGRRLNYMPRSLYQGLRKKLKLQLLKRSR